MKYVCNNVILIMANNIMWKCEIMANANNENNNNNNVYGNNNNNGQ
jgi:hypothetical protein